MGELSKGNRILLFVSVSLATFMMVLDYSIANIAIPYIAGGLAASVDEGIYVITSFSVGNAIGLAMTGWLTKRCGEVRLMVTSILLFTLFSWICGFSFTMNMLVVSRFIQGLVSGPMLPLSQSLLVQYGTLESRTRDLSLFATIVITAPVLGPILGGYLSDWHSWSWIFYINIPLGIFCACVIWSVLRGRESATENLPGDYLGMILLGIGVTCLQIFLDKGQEWDWLNSQTIRALLCGAIICFTFLILRELSYPTPFLALRLFSTYSYTLSMICLLVSYAMYFGTIVLVPLWLQEYMNYTPEWAGAAVAALGVGPIFLSMTTPKLINKIGNVNTLLISFICFSGSCFYSAYFTTAVELQHIAFTRFLFGLGFAFYITSLLGMNIQGIAALDLPQATGMFHFIRAMMGAVGASVFETLWIRRTYFHHERLGESVTLFNPMTPEITNLHAKALLNRALDQQAALLSLNDAFYLMGWLYLGLVVLLVGSVFVQARKKQVLAWIFKRL